MNQTTEEAIGCAFRAANVPGCGFLEKVYEKALAIELKKAGLNVEQQAPVKVWQEGAVVGEYFADLLVKGRVPVELKAVRAFDEMHMAQCLNYLKATRLKVRLLINFGTPRIGVKRVVNSF